MSALSPEREATIRERVNQRAGSLYPDFFGVRTGQYAEDGALLLAELDRLREIERAAVAALHWWRSWQATPEYRRRPLDPGLAGLIAAMDLLTQVLT